jgi:hypothetical protein
MTRQPVSSSSIRSIGHEDGMLEVEFASGQVYRYVGVEPDAFQSLLGAESIGKHFQHAIRGQYEHARVEAEPEAQEAQAAPENDPDA